MKDYLKYVENNEIYVKKVQKKSVNSHFIEEKQKIENAKSNETIKEVITVQKEKYNKTTLNKLKLKELQEIALKYNINIQKLKVGKNKGFKNKTKKELISEIVNQ
jgi:hypothetical protein